MLAEEGVAMDLLRRVHVPIGLDLGATVRIGAGTWTIVGVFDGKGTAFDSEVWADAGDDD